MFYTVYETINLLNGKYYPPLNFGDDNWRRTPEGRKAAVKLLLKQDEG